MMQNNDILCFVRPSSQYREPFLKWLKEAHQENTYLFWDFEFVSHNFDCFVISQLAKEKMCPISKVPETVYWVLAEKQIVGRVSIRHELTDKLRQKGGHIGYQVTSDHRRKGFATKILAFALIEAERLNLKRVLLTTEPNNIASQKAIKCNGGYLLKCLDDLEKEELLKFEISLDC